MILSRDMINVISRQFLKLKIEFHAEVAQITFPSEIKSARTLMIE
jgi:hypothetical protein